MLKHRGSTIDQEIDLSRLKGSGFILLGRNELQNSNAIFEKQSKSRQGFSLSLHSVKNLFRSPRQSMSYKISIYPIYDLSVLISIRNTLTLYTLNFTAKAEKENNSVTGKFIKGNAAHSLSDEEAMLVRKVSIETFHDIKCVCIPEKRYYQHNNEVKIILTFENSSRATIVEIDNRMETLTIIGDLTFSRQKIQCVFSITDNEFIFCTTSKHFKTKNEATSQFVINLHYYCLGKSFKLKSQLKVTVELVNNQNLTSIIIVGKIVDNEDSTLTMFYSIYDPQKLVSRLMAQQIIKKNDSTLALPMNRDLFTVISSLKEPLVDLTIHTKGEFYCLLVGDELAVIKKKFNKYMLIDSISNQIKNQKTIFCKTSQMACTSGKQGIELYSLDMGDPKCSFRLLDLITDCSFQDFRGSLNAIWTYQKEHEIYVGLIYIGNMGKIYFQGVKSIQQIKKLTTMAYNGPRQQVGKIQQMGLKLGISKKDFYLTLWSISSKSLQDINCYLLPCSDLKSIHFELRSFLKRKQLPVGEVIKILDKIELIIFKSLENNLDVFMMRWYLKNNFLTRKFALYPVDLPIDYAGFESIYQMSIYDIIKESIDQELFIPIKPTCTFGVPQLKQKPKIHINHTLQQFRLILLEDYQGFLTKLLRDYKKNIALVLQSFTELLPKFPLKIEMQTEEKFGYQESFLVFQAIMNPQSVQQIWFSNVTISEWDRQKMRKQSIIEKLKPYYATSEIISKLDILMNQDPWFLKKRLEKHILIQSTKAQYKQKLHSLNDKHIYLTICQFANQVQYKCLVDQGQAQAAMHHSHSKISNMNYTDSNPSNGKHGSQSESHSKININTHTFTNLNITNQKHDQIQPIIKILSPASGPKKDILFNQQKVSPISILGLDLIPAHDISHQMSRSFVLQPINSKKKHEKRTLSSKKILMALRKNNNLKDLAYQQCKLYLAIHHFLKIQQLIQEETTVQSLLELNDDELVSLFFLGNKQKKYLIFNDFRSLYPSVGKFNEVIGNFANSPSSSIIELEILLMQLTGKKRQHVASEDQQDRLIQFQKSNQELIKVIIDGFCKKIEIRQDIPIMHFLNLISSVQLNKELLMFVSKISQLRRCFNIFDHFYMSTKTYYQILNDSTSIIQEIMENYFNGQVLHNFIRIQKENIPLEYPRNTFNILLYLRETVFYDVTERDLMMLYSQILIDWKQFDILKELLDYQGSLQILGGEDQLEQFLTQLIVISIEKVYTNESIVFDQQTKQHIRNILLLQSNTTPFTIKEHAKLFIVRLFEKWNCFIRPVILEAMCTQWQEESSSRKVLISEMFSKYIDNITFQNLQQLYQYFEMTATGDPNVQVRTKQFFEYCKLLAQEFIKKQRCQEAAEIISMIRLSEEVDAGYELESQCMLSCLSKKKGYNGLQISRRYIEYMVLNYQNDDVIANLFGTCFNEPDIIQTYESIDVHESLCFRQHGKGGQSEFMRKHGITIPLDGLWQISNTLAENKGMDITTLKGIGYAFDSHTFYDDNMCNIGASKNDSQFQQPRVRGRARSVFNSPSDMFYNSAFNLNVESESPEPEPVTETVSTSNPVLSLMANLFSAVNQKQLINPTKRKRIRKASINLQSMNFSIYNPIMNSYYFLLMGLRFPQLGFQRLYSLPYNFNMLLMLLNRLDNMAHKFKSFWRLNVEQVYQCYRKGLYALLLREVDVDHDVIGLDENYYQQIRERVKDTANSDAIKVQLTKLEAQMQTVKAKRRQREKAHEEQLKKQIKALQRVITNHLDVDPDQSEKLDQSNNRTVVNMTCTYQQVKNMKRQIHNVSRDLTEKMIIDTVVDHMSGGFSKDGQDNRSNTRLLHSSPNGLLDMMTRQLLKETRDPRDYKDIKTSKQLKNKIRNLEGESSVKSCTISDFQMWAIDSDFDNIKKLQPRVVQERLHQLYFSQQLAFIRIINILKQTNIGNPHKYESFLGIDQNWLSLHNKHMKDLFPLDYLLSFEMKSPEDVFSELLVPKLKMILPKLSLANISTMGKILSIYFDNPAVQHEVYGIAIEMIGEDGVFEPQNTFKLEGLINITDIEYLMANYTRLMESMAKTMLREVCHNCIMKKVEGEFQNQNSVDHGGQMQKRQSKGKGLFSGLGSQYQQHQSQILNDS